MKPSKNSAQPDTSALKSQALESRKLILKMITEAGSGHPGGSLSAIDILTALFFSEMNVDPKDPESPNRDRFILSKGHGVPALYATLAYRGFFNPEDTLSLRQLGSMFQGHPDRVRLPILEASTGSLGQGISVAQGIAMACRLDKKDFRVYCLMGDGEIQEGQAWESFMSAANYQLSNLCVFIDINKYQIDGATKNVMNLEPLKDKFFAFKWNALEINGHNMGEILEALRKARDEKSKPTVILAHTIKGKGVAFMEEGNNWHGVAPTKEQLQKALKEVRVVEE